ncbi:MAG: translation initiation factor IF-2 [Defluviitaleaceae bacterium]|nr:translation initiation factor IF-2 [Defluviitaleaceae bacterium]
MRNGFQKRDESRGGFAARPAGKPGFVKKEDKKTVAEPSKDDRKQDWKKNELMRTVKAKDNKDAEKKENKTFLTKQESRGKLRSGKSKKVENVIKKEMPKKVEPVITQIVVPEEIMIKEIAEKLHKSGADILKILMKKGIMASVNQIVDFETAVFIGESFNVSVEPYVEVDVFEEAFSEDAEDDSKKAERPPVVVVMGHVDHGKTSLLDVIRDSSVQQSEAGGITQHIGAYTVTINDRPITFLDTPGHEAFTAMRMRGAQITDIAILAIAADDGVMPQTVEAINHAKAAGVEIIVAITMMDRASANPDKVKQELTEHGLLVEDWGGETIAVPVSARQRTGIEQLLEMIILVADMKELRANPNKPARGSIIEAKLDKGRGPVATVLIQDGTLKVGDPVVAGHTFGKIRAMIDDKGKRQKKAGPSIPVEIVGLSDVPTAGDTFYVATHEKQARLLSESVIAKSRVGMIKAPNKVSLDDLFQQIQAGNIKELNVVVKADVQGSVEALKTSLDKLTNNEVRIKTIHGGVGAVTESDVMLASASNAIIIGFNVRPEPMAKSVADTEKVDIRLYRVIYSAIDDITAAMKGMLDPVYTEKVLGHAEIRQLFRASGVGTIGGAHVLDGVIRRNAQVRIIRDGRVVYEGTLDTLRRFKDDVREVTSGYDCGLLFHRFNDIKENDKVESFTMEEIPR